MKVNKIFCLDVEIVRLLKEEKNASLLINGWARNYYNLDNKFVEPKKEVEEKVEEEKEDLDKIFNQEII